MQRLISYSGQPEGTRIKNAELLNDIVSFMNNVCQQRSHLHHPGFKDIILDRRLEDSEEIIASLRSQEDHEWTLEGTSELCIHCGSEPTRLVVVRLG